jgi:hypothetical protein
VVDLCGESGLKRFAEAERRAWPVSGVWDKRAFKSLKLTRLFVDDELLDAGQG